MVNMDGLTELEAGKRLDKYGENSLSFEKKASIVEEFLSNFKSPLVIVLLIIVGVSVALRNMVDALMVLAMIVLSVTLNFFQEHKASRASEKLKGKVALRCVVIRGGVETEILASKVVPGDILELNAGDIVAADAKLLAAKDVFVNQSALTGESFPLERNDGDEVFAGTFVVTGTARAIVIKTGVNTEFGKIAKSIKEERDDNEFTLGVKDFSNFILRIIVIFVVVVFLGNVFIKHDIALSIMFAVAVAVGLIPEFLPMIMTVTMSRGSINMAKRGVIVKKLTAIPTFGGMDILCTDKTGTLTEDHIRLVKYVDLKGKESEEVFRYAYLNSFFQTGITNPLDKAVVDYKMIDTSACKKIDEIPFDFERKKMSVVVDTSEGRFLVSKGAPEEIVKGNKKYLDIYERLSRDGYRVLAIAVKKIPKNKNSYSKSDEVGLTPMGFVAFLDPPRPGVKEAIDAVEAMGIEVKVITGDNELVTRKVCLDAGILVKGLMVGGEVDGLTDEELYQRATACTIFARFSPVQKARVISVLKMHGRVVGYMGDGINDAPSLRAADVGISVANAVDVARESADIILTHKSLHELRNGVIEGRKTFGNTMKYIMMGLSSNFGNMFSVLGAVVFLPFLPMLPIQILLNNFLYDVSQLSLPFDEVDAEFVKMPKRWDVGMLKNFMLTFGPISSIFDVITFVVLYGFFKNMPGSFQTGWFMESLATQTLVIHIIRTRKLPLIQSVASPLLWISTLTVVGVGWILPMSSLGRWFGFTQLPIGVIALLAAIVGGYLVVVEVGKWMFYRRWGGL